jgi:Myo-inositol-1-phosphate synthase
MGVPVGSLTQMGTIRIGRRIENNFPKIKDFLPLYELDQLVFGGWDINDESALDGTKTAEVLNEKDINKVADELATLRPMKAVFDKEFVKKLDGNWVKKANTKMELMEMLRNDIRQFKADNHCDDMIVIWCASTEVYTPIQEVHSSIEKFEEGMRNNNLAIAPSMLYAWAALLEGVPFINGAPNLTIDTPAAFQLAEKLHVPIAGKDFKNGPNLSEKPLLHPC